MTDTRTWLDHAACLGHWRYFDGNHPGENSHKNNPRNRPSRRHQAALAICRECPVWWECRTWALHNYEDDSAIIGGMTGPQRRDWRRTHQLDRPADIRPYDWLDRKAIGQ
jgi:hypothetical protein